MFDSMTPDALMIELRTRGIVLRRSGHRLMVRDPGQALTPELSTLIKLYKPVLLDRLNIPRHGGRVAVEVWPTEPARYNLLMCLLSDARCIEFYAAGAALGEAIDRENETEIEAAQARFDRARVDALALAGAILEDVEPCARD